MSDYERFIKMCNDFGVEYSANEEANKDTGELENVVTFYEGNKVRGYCNFFSEWRFNKNGAFIEIGNWE